jgi:hypothetical protein
VGLISWTRAIVGSEKGVKGEYVSSAVKPSAQLHIAAVQCDEGRLGILLSSEEELH